jgi:hypothetical protein
MVSELERSELALVIAAHMIREAVSIPRYTAIIATCIGHHRLLATGSANIALPVRKFLTR